MHNQSHACGAGEEGLVVNSASEEELTGLLVIAYASRAAGTSGESRHAKECSQR